jgi:hypothetical protein
MSSEVDPAGLASRILELLKAGPEDTLELSLLKDGSLRITKES